MIKSFYIGNYYFNFSNLRKKIFLKLKKPQFHNLHNNEKILIIGTGPSFTKKKIKLLIIFPMIIQ